MSKHIHSDIIIAYTNGAKIQVLVKNKWVDLEHPSFLPENWYRIKPATITLKYRRYVYVDLVGINRIGITHPDSYQSTVDIEKSTSFIKWIDFVWKNETLEIKG